MGKNQNPDIRSASGSFVRPEAEGTFYPETGKFIAGKKRKRGFQILKKNVRIETGMTFCKCVCTYQAYTSDTRRIPSMQTEVMEDNEEGTFS